MNYISTRDKNKILTASQAIIQGISPDGGLFVPEHIPSMPFSIESMVGKSYQEIAIPILSAFLTDFSESEIRNCVYNAYDEKFSTKDITAISAVDNKFFLELYHGKTAAFKDMALSILPHLLITSLRKNNRKDQVCILTATSGDTGKAALEGFANIEDTHIIVFYPRGGVSKAQELQMLTQAGNNTHVASIDGNFDQAQSSVKEIFGDASFAHLLSQKGIIISSANSINIGRLVPQVVYYIYGYIKLLEAGSISNGDKINICVPTGNFGNILAAYYAKKMGLPVNKLICASNDNKILADFFNSGSYDLRRDFILTTSPSMDIIISSNLERLVYEICNKDSVKVSLLMKQMKDEGFYNLNAILEQDDFYGGYATMDQVKETIKKYYALNYLIDPHTAVATKVLEDYMETSKDRTTTLIASTASPYKFATTVLNAITEKDYADDIKNIYLLEKASNTRIPYPLMQLDKKPILHDDDISTKDMKAYITRTLSL